MSKHSWDKEGQMTDIWRRYDNSRAYLDAKGLVEKTNENWRFYLGDQWHGLESGGERLPLLNFIKGVVRYKTAVVAQNTMTASYSSMEPEAGVSASEICDLLNRHFRKTWEKGKLDSSLWEIVKAAQIQGDSYLYCGTPSDMKPQILSNVNVLLSDEQEPDIQAQKYILIYERRFVSSVLEEAKKNGVSKEAMETIAADDETHYQLGNITEVGGADGSSSGDGGKCTSILYLYKDRDGIVHMARSTRTCVYQPDIKIQPKDSEGNDTGSGLRSYPIVSFIWERVPNSARGQSEVRHLIPNQLELNKTLARRSMAVKLCAFPRIAYDINAVNNPDALDNVGMKIQLNNGSARAIDDMIRYLNPSTMSPDAKYLSDELMNATRELAGAGDAATGSVDPTQASGAAIIAVKNQNELPLNENVAAKAQFIEDLALLWFDLWTTYNPEGLEVTTEKDGQEHTVFIPPEQLEKMKVNVRVDVCQANPFSRLAQEQALERFEAMGKITFDEYIEALDDNSNVPKAKLRDILEKRHQSAAPQVDLNAEMPGEEVRQNEMYAVQQ